MKNSISKKEQGKISFEQSSKTSPDVKLPKLTLSTFSRNAYEWITFADLFKFSAHDNQNLSNGQKSNLLSAFKNNAFWVVKSI